MSDSYRRMTCRLCNGDSLCEVLDLTPTPRANEFVERDQLEDEQSTFPLQLVQCEACGHVQLYDVVEAGSLFRDYVYVSGTSPSFVRHFQAYAEDLVAAYALEKDTLVVDVGSNDGTLLRSFKNMGFHVLGIDPARAIAEAATLSGIETICDFLSVEIAEGIVEAHGQCSLVTANNVFAHVDDLEEFTMAARTMLQPDGLFTFEVSYLLDVFQKTLFDTIYHEHLDYHTVAPLAVFFDRLDMQLIDVKRIATHGGSIRCIVQHKAGKRPMQDTVAELSALENQQGLHAPPAFMQLSEQIAQVKHDLGSLLRGFQEKGLKIGAYGAPAKATTLLYHFGLDENVIEFIIDDSPLKQGLFTPGMHIPVLPSSEIDNRKPDVLVILAWNFADAIIENNLAYLQHGGYFVVPLPEVRVVKNH